MANQLMRICRTIIRLGPCCQSQRLGCLKVSADWIVSAAHQRSSHFIVPASFSLTKCQLSPVFIVPNDFSLLVILSKVMSCLYVKLWS
jgi:hypothetical protein